MANAYRRLEGRAWMTPGRRDRLARRFSMPFAITVVLLLAHPFPSHGKGGGGGGGGGGRGGGGGGARSGTGGSASKVSEGGSHPISQPSVASSTTSSSISATGGTRNAASSGAEKGQGSVATGLPVAGNVASGRPLAGNVATGFPAGQMPAGYPHVVQRPPGYANVPHTYPYVYHRPTGPVAYNSGQSYAGLYRPPGVYQPSYANRPFRNSYPAGYSLMFIPAFAAGYVAGHHWGVYSHDGTFVGYDSSPDEPDYYDYDDALPAGCSRLHAHAPVGEPSLAPASDFQMVLLDGVAMASDYGPSPEEVGPAGKLVAPAMAPSQPGLGNQHVQFACLPVLAANNGTAVPEASEQAFP